jgi:hypothetical protein
MKSKRPDKEKHSMLKEIAPLHPNPNLPPRTAQGEKITWNKGGMATDLKTGKRTKVLDPNQVPEPSHKALLVRIPADLMKRLKLTAVIENTSLQDLVAEALEAHLKTRKSKLPS